MRIRFGLHRDGLDPSPPITAVGEITAGPKRLLRLLESDLGIAQPPTHPAEEVDLYRACLGACDRPARFYHRSFAVDPVGVARTLLDWRREWHLHGWDGTFPGGAGRRLADMAAVEPLARQRLPPCAGERLARIARLLESRRTQIEAVELLEHPDDLPATWRRLFDRLPCTALAEPANPAEMEGCAAPETDLGRVQELLRSGAAPPLAGDGSVLALRAASRDVTAQATAELLRAADAGQSAVVIAPRDGIILDNALERVGLPRIGFPHYSPLRAASEVLKLALALLWTPLDPHRLLQFLIHPVAPLPWPVRARLAEAVSAQPGIGGPAWQSAMEDIEANGADGAAVRFWTAPERFAADAGAPADALAHRARRCAAWLRERLALLDGGEGAEGRAVFGAALAQANALASAFARIRDRGGGAARIGKPEVDRLLDEATRSLPDETAGAQAGHVPGTTHPGNVTEAVDAVYWWDLAPEQVDPAPPWTASELRQLADAGVALPSAAQRIAAGSRAWRRAAMRCRRRLVLVVHDDAAGRHPLWGRLREQLREAPGAQVHLDDGLLRGTREPLARLGIDAPELPLAPLPAARRWWHLDRPLPAPTDVSYSSLAKAYYHPHAWVLRYHAGLRGSRMAGVADGALLKGSLAHRLFERFFNERAFSEHANWRTLDAEALRAWLDATLPDLIKKEGAVLLEHGRGVDRQQTAATLERALIRLLEQLRAAGVVRVQSEHAVEKPFPGGMLRGEADLVLTDAAGARAVLDAKWSGERRRRQEIEDGRHLQLAVYGFALEEDGRWPTAGYYIISSGSILACADGFFADARGVGGEPIDSVWRRSLATHRWRCGQFADGWIEVNAGAEADARSAPPPDALETRVEADRFDEFRWLTGFAP